MSDPEDDHYNGHNPGGQCLTCRHGKFQFNRFFPDTLCVFCLLFLLKEKYTDRSIRNRLLERLLTLPPQDIEFVMPQLSQLALTFPSKSFSKALSRVLVELTTHFMHLALKLTWWLEAAAYYLDTEAVKRGNLLIDAIETSLIQGTPDVHAFESKQGDEDWVEEEKERKLKLTQEGDKNDENTTKNDDLTTQTLSTTLSLQDRPGSSLISGPNSWKLDLVHKKARSDFFTAHLQLLRILNSTSTQLTPLSRPKRKQLLPYCLAHIKANGLYFPVFDALNEHFIIRHIYPDQGIVLNSRDKAPFLVWAQVEFTDKPLFDEDIYRPTALPLIEAHLREEMETTIDSSTTDTTKSGSLDAADDDETTKSPTTTPTTANTTENTPVLPLKMTPSGPTTNVYDPFGETYDQRTNRLLYETETPETNPNVALLSVIFKGGDDCRQEVIAMQWISLFDQIFTNAQLPLQLRPYGVLVTSSLSGIIETLVNSTSIDGLKKGLPPGMTFPKWFFEYFSSLGIYHEAVQNFVESIAGYSLVCYFLQIKDRHNGNIMLDNEGRVIHIDFGFILSSSPGGNMNFENVPFKLTQEYVQIMGGEDGEPYRQFQAHFIRGFIEVRKHFHKFVMLADIMRDGNILAFKVGGKQTVAAFRARFAPDLTEAQAVEFAAKLVVESCNHWRSSQYDEYQRFTNGIL